MKKRDQFAPPVVGGSSLLVIFAVLCLVVFALLSINAAKAEQRQADASSKAIREYYNADIQAQEVYAQLRSGRTVEAVREEDGIYAYEIPISEGQVLAVRLEKDGETWNILRWEAMPVESELDESLDIWKGTEGEP